MKGERSASYRLSGLFVLLSLAGILGNCGGSTTGTGGITINGAVVSSDGGAVSPMAVTVLETGDAAQTDAAGLFEIDTERAPSYTLLFEARELNAQTRLENVPGDARVVHAVFRVRPRENAVATESVSIDREKPRRRPDAVEDGGARAPAVSDPPVLPTPQTAPRPTSVVTPADTPGPALDDPSPEGGSNEDADDVKKGNSGNGKPSDDGPPESVSGGKPDKDDKGDKPGKGNSGKPPPPESASSGAQDDHSDGHGAGAGRGDKEKQKGAGQSPGPDAGNGAGSPHASATR